MNLVSFKLFIIGVAALFNVVWHHPEVAPTFYQLTLTTVQHAICDFTASSALRGSLCKVLDTLRLPAPPLVLTIAASESPTWPYDLVDTNTTISGPDSTSLVHIPSEPELPIPPVWLHDAADILLLLFVLAYACGVVLGVFIIYARSDVLSEHIARGYTWLFWGPSTFDQRIDELVFRTPPVGVVKYVEQGSYKDIDIGNNLTHKPSAPPSTPQPVTAPTPEPQPEPQPEPVPEPRKRVRIGARCKRIRKQKAIARAQQQEPTADEAEEREQVEPEVVERRGSSRGGKQVRKRQRRQERKEEARRADANAEAGPSSTSDATPEFVDEDFPPLAGVVVGAHPVHRGLSYAAVAATGKPSASAVVRKGSWTAKANPAFEQARAVVQLRPVVEDDLGELRERWIELDEEAWRKGRRKEKRDSWY